MLSGTVSPYIPKSWFHPLGIFKVVADMMPRLPDVTGSLFLTFTTNQTFFAGPESAYDYSRKRLRKLFYALRQGVEWEGKTYRMDAPYCVKVEFHKNGWAHYHVIFLTKRHLPGALLNHLWGLGRTNVKRITNKDFHYLLKYVCKGGEIPDWVLKRTRIRIFQTSKGFYAIPRDKPKPETEDGEDEAPETDGKAKTELTIGERIEQWKFRATFIVNSNEKTYYHMLNLSMPYQEVLGALILGLAQAKRYLGQGHILITNEYQLDRLESYTT